MPCCWLNDYQKSQNSRNNAIVLDFLVFVLDFAQIVILATDDR